MMMMMGATGSDQLHWRSTVLLNEWHVMVTIGGGHYRLG